MTAPEFDRQREQKHSPIGAALALSAWVYGTASGLAGGCVISDRSFELETVTFVATPQDPDAAPPPRATCDEYCDEVMERCAGPSQVYTDRAQCLAVCNALPPGTPGEAAGNSVACRLSWLKGPAFEVNLCSDVGPVSRGQCGDRCEAFCALRRVACSAVDETNFEFTQENYCEAGCAQLTDLGAYSVSANPDGVPDYENGDTLQCRIGHLALALADPQLAAMQCTESRIVPLNQLGSCQDDISIGLERDRETYCRLVQHACKGGQAVYSSLDECEAVSQTFERGMPEDTAENTLRCRRYHAYNAFENPGTHCTHAGPTGDGTCAAAPETQQGNCISYCRILVQACPLDYQSLYGEAGGDALTTCVEECTELPDSAAGGFRTEPRYSVTATLGPGSLKCNTLYAVRALADPNGPDCDAAVGEEGSACATPEGTADPE